MYQVTHCEEENTELKRVNKLLTVQRNDALSQFDQLTIEKQCMQTEMYSKFVEVLNEKKKKLRQYKGIRLGNPAYLAENAKRNVQPLPSLGTLDDDEEESWYAVKICSELIACRTLNSQVQTGESQISPFLDTASMASVTGPTPTLELDDGSYETFEPTVRKRFRANANSTDSETNATRSSVSALTSTSSHGISVLDPKSPVRTPSKRKVLDSI